MLSEEREVGLCFMSTGPEHHTDGDHIPLVSELKHTRLKLCVPICTEPQTQVYVDEEGLGFLHTLCFFLCITEPHIFLNLYTVNAEFIHIYI